MNRLRRILAPLLQPSAGPASVAGAERSGPRIAVIGHCQARAVASAMRLFVPDARITFLSVFALPGRFPRLADLTAALRPHDAVFGGRLVAPLRDGTDFEAFKAARPVTEIPVLVFPAFHPDLVYVTDLADRTGRALVQSGVGDYHSALVLFAYLERLGEDGARRLFCPEVFRRLGYLDLWDASVAGLREAGRLAGQDLTAEVVRWSRRGPFMHSTNHPKMFVAADLARRALTQAGLPWTECEAEGLLPDEFIRQGTWPVYPAIADRYGIPGSELFLTQGTRTGEGPRTLTLDRFIAASFAAYRRHGRSDLSCPRVTAWRTDPAIWADLRSHAA